MTRNRTAQWTLVVIAALLAAPRAGAQAPGWPDIYDPFTMHTLNLSMNGNDWQTVQNDNSLSIQVPALFWTGNEAPITVTVRRKSATALTGAQGYKKVSLKIDVNALVSGQSWHGLKKLSVENGDDMDVVTEGLAWAMHRLAAADPRFHYDGGLAAWVRLVINGVDTGVYVNVEQRDKQFLRNRGVYAAGETWLYKVSGVHSPELKVGSGNSPTFVALCYPPFQGNQTATCSTPDPATLAAQVPTYVNMDGMLTVGAVTAFVAGADALFPKAKNFYFADFLNGPRRMYLAWDLDSVMGGQSVNFDIYTGGNGSPNSRTYQSIILTNPTFRAQYSQIMNDLICGPLSEASIIALIDGVEPVISAAVAADPNNQIGSPAGHFQSIRDFVGQRIANVAGQIDNYQSCTTPPQVPGDLNCDGVLDTADIGPFSLVLVDPAAYGAAFPTCSPSRADLNGDGANNGIDIGDFIIALIQP